MTNKIKIGIIGGSGIYKFNEVKQIKQHKMETPYGIPSCAVSELAVVNAEGEFPFYFIARHGEGHSISPSEINYCANIFALKKLGVDYIVSISAVGSLQEGINPKTFVLPTQFVDWTKGIRKRSFFGEGIVGHVSVANPVALGLQSLTAKVCEKVGVQFLKGGTYVCIEGPQFSTKAESQIYRSFGATVIGMTNVPEAYLAKEAGMAYCTIAMVTDYDCWKEEHCTLDEIMQVMESNKEAVKKIVLELVPEISKAPPQFTPENRDVVVTAAEKMKPFHKEILSVLLRDNQ
ncbi:MAG: S-methyl-5'-thioadenosine phosphorylase [Oligoflexia bacterium]|nr:S-methyl-5'-thioadenosine phosphorylase [Oligoflexia bacterium]